jgi:anaerobic ribonucleoside-triphosphate reductase
MPQFVVTNKTRQVTVCAECGHSMTNHRKGGWCGYCECGSEKQEAYYRDWPYMQPCECGHSQGSHRKRCRSCPCQAYVMAT